MELFEESIAVHESVIHSMKWTIVALLSHTDDSVQSTDHVLLCLSQFGEQFFVVLFGRNQRVFLSVLSLSLSHSIDQMMPSVHLFGEHRISGLILFGGHLVQSADNSWPRALHPSPGIFVELSDNSETGLLVLLDSLFGKSVECTPDCRP